MYEENDYIMRQIKSMVRGLGKFMGLEQIKDILQINVEQQGTITDDELETIIVISKLEIIMPNKDLGIDEMAKEVNISSERMNQLINENFVATKEELTQLNQFIIQNSEFL